MSTNVDLRELAIERNGPQSGQRAIAVRRWVSRYLLPAGLFCGFVTLIAWASWDMLFPPAPVQVTPVFSTTATVQRGGTPLFKAAGWIEPRPTPLRVPALAPGVVKNLWVVEDQPLEVGDSIAQLVDEDARLAVKKAEADLKLRRAELKLAESVLTAAETRLNQPVHLEATLREAEASLAKNKTLLKNLPFEARRAKADRDTLQKDYESKLAAKGVVARIEIEIAKGKLDSAKAQVEEFEKRESSLRQEQEAISKRCAALRTQLQLLADEKRDQESAQAKVDSATARVDQAKVVLAEAELRLKRMTITSPVAGRVYQLVAHPGSRIGSGMTQMKGHDGSTIVTLYQPNHLQIRVDVRFEDLPKIELNQPVRIENAALKKAILGHVLFISSEADIQKNTLEVKVAIPDPPGVLKPEMLVDVTLLAPDKEDRTTSIQQVKQFVPDRLVQRDDSGPFLWLADQSQGVARRVSVTLGVRQENGFSEIVEGLSETNRVISKGFDRLKDGDRIRITGEDESIGMDFLSPASD